MAIENISRFDGAPIELSLSEEALEAFRTPNFDPVDYLNANLPLWSTTSSKQQSSTNVSLAEFANQTQTLLSQLNGQLTRLSTTLNQLTDEIIRSGGRLAYEVEVLQGDTASLADVLGNGLRKDIRMFLPSGLPQRRGSNVNGNNGQPEDAATDIEKPEYISRLQTLTHVRSRLQEVIHVFEDAMDWELQPSEVRSSINAVSSTESQADVQARELRGRDFVEKLREEINGLIQQAEHGRHDSATQAAFGRLEELRDLAVVWKGTAEERPRLKLVDNMWKLVQDKE